MALLKGFLLAFIAIAYQVENAASTVTFTSSTTTTVRENAANGASVLNVTATVTGSKTLIFTLVSQKPNKDPKVFAIATTGEVTVGDKTHLDFETTQSYTLVIKAADAGNTVNGTTTVTVTVTDVNEAPTFAEASYSACVNTSSPAGTTVIQVTATDVDAGDTSLTYNITSGDTDDLFADPANGVIKLAAGKTVGDTPTSYSLVLVANDDDSTPLSGTATVSVIVKNPDQSCPPPAPENSAVTAMIPFRVLMVCVFITAFNFCLF